MLRTLRRNARIGTVACLLVLAVPAVAVEEVIDDFSDALLPPGTLLGNPPSNVLVDLANTTVTGLDTGVSGVIGGARRLDVSVTSCTFCPFDNAIAGVLPSARLLDYSSTTGADGAFELIYDADGAGLNASLSFAEGIRVPLINIDAASFPFTVMVTLTSGPNSAVRALTIPNGPMDIELDFAFAAFTGIAGVDLDNLTRIRILVDPSDGSAAGDLQLSPLLTFGTPDTETACLDGVDNDNDGVADCDDPDCVGLVQECAAPAPALSPTAMMLLLAVLAGSGFLGIARLRSRLRRPQS